MKYLALFLSAMIFAISIYAQQNYVPNGSFEEYTVCPTSSTSKSIYNSSGWRQYNFTGSYFYNICNTTGLGVPGNQDGYQFPAHGNAYAGVEFMNALGDDKSYLARKIIPLFPGARYEVSMSVSLSNRSQYACNGFGAFFYHSGPDSIPGVGTAPVTPKNIIYQLWCSKRYFKLGTACKYISC